MKNIYRKGNVGQKGSIRVNNSFEGKTIEEQLRALMAGETIETKGRPMVYTEKKDGVMAETNIRSDRFQLAQDANDYVVKSNVAKRDALKKEAEKTSTSETTQGTEK